MRFEWDENKRLTNLQRHGIDFADVWEVFAYDTVPMIDNRFDYGEVRWLTYGLLRDKVVAVVHTETDDLIRIISVRNGTKNEQIKYFSKIRN
jgi:uncharacterized protein